MLRGVGFAAKHDTYGEAVLEGTDGGAYMGSSLVSTQIKFCAQGGAYACTLFEGKYKGGLACNVTESKVDYVACVLPKPSGSVADSKMTLKLVIDHNGE